MNWKSQYGLMALVTLVILVAFGAGYQLRAQEEFAEWVPPSPSPVYSLLHKAEGRLLVDARASSDGAGSGSGSARTYPPDLKPYQTILEVRKAIKNNFVRTDVDDTELTYGAVRGMLEALGDRFTRFLTPEEYEEFQVKSEGEFVGIGASIDIKQEYSGGPQSKPYGATRPYIVEPIEGSPAAKAGLQQDDVILAIDARSTANMSDSAVVSFIRGKAGTKVTLKIERIIKPKDPKADPEWKVLDISVTRDVIEMHPVKLTWLPDNIAWLKLTEFNKKSEREILVALKQVQKGPNGPTKGLILDMRNNPGGLLDVAVEIGSHFVAKGPVVVTRERDGHEEPLNADHRLHLDLDMPIVVLINKYSASAAEILTGALKDNKLATVVGEHSYGKASVQVIVELQNKGALVMTTAKYLTPGRHDITEKGIAPDVEVHASAEDEKNGDGAQLQKAIALIKEKSNTASVAQAR